ncbi:MAG: sigma-70 family RNA polymerase sigma factor [Bacteroidales bacterium]|jgi:RNA polymerase sigma-70 factor (ECF subfamily)|nr:sigma-70 family RNA polymerase sigma factor [Bacteroidales bacterium]
MTESGIIRDILEGDREKFRLLVEKYQPLVFRTCIGFVHDKDDADDLTQEVFIQAYQSLSRFRGNSAFSTWLYRIAVNASLNSVRRSSKNFIVQRFNSLFGSEKTSDIPFSQADADDPENILIRKEHVVRVQKAIDSLPENQRTAIILSKYDDLSQKEIAAIMNITEGAVESLLQRAKQNLREKLSAGRGKNP